jgi:hypothetical protein
MYILGLSSSCGTSGICPAWSLLSINWLRLCPQFGACVQSHTVRRRLFIFLMTAAHISPNVFSLRNLLSNIHVLFLTIHSTSFKPIIHHIHTNNYLFYLHDIPLFFSLGLHGCPQSLVSITIQYLNTVQHVKSVHRYEDEGTEGFIFGLAVSSAGGSMTHTRTSRLPLPQTLGYDLCCYSTIIKLVSTSLSLSDKALGNYLL